MCTREPSTVQGFASNGYRRISRMVQKRLLRCVIGIATFHVHHHRGSLQTFCQEAIMWRRLKHPNIVPLLGVTITPKFQLVSDWMSGGDLPEHLKKNPDADRLKLVGIPPVALIPYLLLSPVIRRCKRPLLPPLLQCDSRRPQRGTWLFQFEFHRNDRCPAKHPHGCFWQRTSRGFWPRRDH